jgi:predicted ATP-grasp superfamily ATP-dependent carboligase
MPFLSEFIHKVYGLQVRTHKAYKELDLDDKKIILHMNSIPEEVFAFVQEDVREGYDQTKKKKKKKKKDKDKKKKDKKKNKKMKFNKDRLEAYGYDQIMKGKISDNEEENATPIPPRKIFKRIDR